MGGVQDLITQLSVTVGRLEESNHSIKENVGVIRAQITALSESMTKLTEQKNKEHEELRMSIYKIGTIVTIACSTLIAVGKEVIAKVVFK